MTSSYETMLMLFPTIPQGLTLVKDSTAPPQLQLTKSPQFSSNLDLLLYTVLILDFHQVSIPPLMKIQFGDCTYCQCTFTIYKSVE